MLLCTKNEPSTKEYILSTICRCFPSAVVCVVASSQWLNNVQFFLLKMHGSLNVTNIGIQKKWLNTTGIHDIF